ncbi:unnamed protein product [Tilletia laevis]|uniref:Uncharacterized protein n=2 Tax=Tilletia TaxID=13289 RepID=A0A8T8T9S7_9BASI|nr:hypothetical protein CF335_g7697 [Tilletia laevis]KAE8258031.1 hypothetical protein A4X03_0g4504 [Tilletia caries]CAD6974031.1 unnamed protein product [Tilletia controversa]KAE8188134.1 hypothetical protein CF336_g6279 [Tilletia laevis]CAD6892263.1 unnamed protein product [Tilletia caries]
MTDQARPDASETTIGRGSTKASITLALSRTPTPSPDEAAASNTLTLSRTPTPSPDEAPLLQHVKEADATFWIDLPAQVNTQDSSPTPKKALPAKNTSAAHFGAGLVLVFPSITNYLVDSYLLYASSVLAANSIIRSLFGMAFPLFTPAMYDSLGIHGAPALAAGLAALCVPFPFLLYRYGPAIWTRCRYAAEAAKLLDQIFLPDKGRAT